MAQVVGRLTGGQEAAGSSPVTPISRKQRKIDSFADFTLFFKLFAIKKLPTEVESFCDPLDQLTHSIFFAAL